MTLAILCSGQGLQHPDMFALTANVPEADSLFKHASKLLGGRDPRDIVKTETYECLHQNRISQILCVLQALAAATALGNKVAGRVVIAGYSVGELAAWGVADIMSMADTLDLVARRAEVMDQSTNPGDGLLFVRGLSRETMDNLCADHHVDIAIVNPGDAFVLGGSRAALESLGLAAKSLRAKNVVEVPVEVASHTVRLTRASEKFRRSLSHIRLHFPPNADLRILSGIDGSPVIQAEAGLDKLAAQLSQTVLWTDCLQGCIEAGANAFLELGPGAALSDMVAGAYQGVSTRGLEDFKTLEGAGAWLAIHASA
ncbi:acyltransferase domain-containing protein [Phyllobacterium zundukense]|uniref:Acyltransferase domain-containing protein n=1 Tax=Phyllobacterium zundukense TaxID=1867719 RepID=A0ACD4CY38_9HYPH|nr:acyltransferase domain-containing protein [Phyllobacterium zundukense]UXN58474.1 acyltransferase domain-containing protein [Phyllobacterium zundukense]